MIRRLIATTVLVSTLVGTTAPPMVAGTDTDLPAGAQFPDDPELVPADLQQLTPGLVAERDGTLVVLGNLRRPVGRAPGAVGPVGVAVRAPDGTWATATVDDLRGFRPPRGLSRRLGFFPAAMASGEDGFVAIGRATHLADCGSRCNIVGDRGWISSLIWFSADGRTWQRIDPRRVLGQGPSIALQAVTSTPDGGWLIAGSTATTDFRRPSRLVILSSPDGVTWRRSATISGSRALEASGFLAGADGPVLSGFELVCTRDSSHHSITSYPTGRTMISTIAQVRLWAWREASGQRAQGGGAPVAGWSAVDLRPSGVIEAPPVRRLRAADCNVFDSARVARTSGTGTVVGAAGGRIVAVDGEGVRVATTIDLQTWTVADLPGAQPAGDPTRSRGLAARSVLPNPDGTLTLLSLEARRDPDSDEVAGRGQQVIAWRSEAEDASWSRSAAGRPLLLGLPDANPVDFVPAAMLPQPDGSVVLHEVDHASGEGQLRRSVAGPLVAWGSCTPGPGADCAFATLEDDAVGVDLAGIDLTGARVGFTDWTGVDLTGADLRLASVAADLTGADLSGVRAGRAGFWGDVAGVTLADADLRGASLPLAVLASDATTARLAGATITVPSEQPEGLRLAGLDLSGVAFFGSSPDLGDLRDLDVRDTRLDGARFSSVDLTGTRLRDARYERLSFSGVTCPDGKPTTAGAFGPEACRLPSR